MSYENWHHIMTKCMKPYIGPLLKEITSRLLRQQTPHQLYGVIWRVLTQESWVESFEHGPENSQLQALCHIMTWRKVSLRPWWQVTEEQRRWGLVHVARHVIQHTLNPRFLSQWHPMMRRAISGGLVDVDRHVIQHTLNPRFLSRTASYDAASHV